VRLEFEWLANDIGTATVPAGFVTDLASIPRPFWALLPKWDGYGGPAIVHDFLYSSQHTTRYIADQWILSGMEDMKVGPIKRYAIYSAVRLFGGFAWSSNLKKKAQKRFSCIPVDALTAATSTTTWEQLKPYAVPCGNNYDAAPRF
jgi:hypothetical protein